MPFTIAVDPLFRDNAGVGWISARPLAEIPPRPAHNGQEWIPTWGEWAEEAEAVSASPLRVAFTVQGVSEAQVTLTGLEFQVIERLPATRGVLYYTGGGEQGEFRRIAVDLSHDPPRRTDLDNEFATASPVQFPYLVSVSDAETFVVTAGGECTCSYVMELSWASQGATGVYIVDNDGEPFRVSGLSNIMGSCMVFGPDEQDCLMR